MEPSESSVADDVTNFINSLLPRRKLHPVNSFRIEPQSLSDIHARAKSVYPDCFVGAKISAVREVGGKFKLSQQYDYRYQKVSNRSFAHFLHKEMAPKAHRNEVVVDTRGSATVTYTEETESGVAVKVSSKIKDITASEVDVTIGKSTGDGRGSVSMSTEDVNPHSLKIVTSYMHGLSRHVSVGAEVTSCPLSECARPELTFSARYCVPSMSLSTTLGKNGFQICFFKRFSERLKFASIVDHGNYGERTTASLAIQNNVRPDSRVKLFVDSNRTGGFTFEKDVFVREPSSDLKVMRVVASTLMDREQRIEFGLGFFLDL